MCLGSRYWMSAYWISGMPLPDGAGLSPAFARGCCSAAWAAASSGGILSWALTGADGALAAEVGDDEVPAGWGAAYW
jgi:hypothetical protein